MEYMYSNRSEAFIDVSQILIKSILQVSLISWSDESLTARLPTAFPESYWPNFKINYDQIEEEEDGDGEEDPIDMSFPKEGGWKKIVVYLISFPIMAPLFYTLPDTKNKESKIYSRASLQSSIAFEVFWVRN